MLKEFAEFSDKELILKKAREKYPEYAKKEDGDKNFFEIRDNFVIFNEYNWVAEWSEPVLKVSISDIMK